MHLSLKLMGSGMSFFISVVSRTGCSEFSVETSVFLKGRCKYFRYRIFNYQAETSLFLLNESSSRLSFFGTSISLENSLAVSIRFRSWGLRLKSIAFLLYWIQYGTRHARPSIIPKREKGVYPIRGFDYLSLISIMFMVLREKTFFKRSKKTSGLGRRPEHQKGWPLPSVQCGSGYSEKRPAIA